MSPRCNPPLSATHECQPLTPLSTCQVEFGEIAFGRRASRRTAITNTGQTTLQFSFVGASDVPRWLLVAPWSGLLLPGEACTLTVSIEVGPADADAIFSADGDATLEAILLLRLHNGRDFYLPVGASIRPTSRQPAHT